jgi:hypothetical protein
MQSKEGPTAYAPYQRTMRRTAAGWQTEYRLVGAERPEQAIVPGAAVEGQFLGDSVRPVVAIQRRWPKGELTERPLRHWQDHFHGVPTFEADRYDYPRFTSEEFWRSYGEPIGVFLRPIQRLAEALVVFQEGWLNGEEWRARNAELALAEINDAAFGTHQVGHFDHDGRFHLRWSPPSLLGAFAMLLLHDVDAGQQAIRCPICDGLFLSRAYQARFCSSACRAAHHKRQQRKRAAGDESAE